MSISSCFLRKNLTSSYPKFEGSRRWLKISLLTVLVVSSFSCLHTGGINLSCLVLRPHYPNIQNNSLPSKLNGSNVGAAVSFAASIYCTLIANIANFYNSNTYSALGVCDLVDCIGAGEWMSGTRHANCCLAHLILLGVCRMYGNFMAVAACFFVLLS